MNNPDPFMCGVIEGFFGKAWTWSARAANVSFLRDWGYQFYMYAPKGDAYLRRRWRDPVPPETLDNLRTLSERCDRNNILFGLGLTPFEIYRNYDGAARADLRSKVLQLNTTGAKLLGVLFDDMRGDTPDLAQLQARIVADVCSWSSAERFIVCPTYYSDDPRLAKIFGAAPQSYLQGLGRLVAPEVDFFWTGERVISDGYTEQHLADVSERLGRKPFIWDNHIANDSRDRSSCVFFDPAQKSWSLPAGSAAGLAVNPMNQPYLSRIALAAYRHILSGSGGGQMSEIWPSVCAQDFSEQLEEDALSLQRTGIAGLDGQRRAELIERLQREPTNPYAQDLAAWLRGEYEFDPQCLTS